MENKQIYSLPELIIINVQNEQIISCSESFTFMYGDDVGDGVNWKW